MATRAKVNPRTQSPSHEISLSDGVQTWGIRLEDSVRSIQETPMTASTLLINSQGGKFGDYDPSMSHIQQANWQGGRGQEYFAEDQTRYFDSKNMWTFAPEGVFPSLQWKFATGYRKSNLAQFGASYNWRSLVGVRYSRRFSDTAGYSADKVYLWVKQIGTPGTLTVTLNADSVGGPSTVLQTVTLAPGLIEKNVMTWKAFDWASTQALSAATNYHVVVYGASTDNIENHWEILSEIGNTPPFDAFSSTDNGSSWSSSNYKFLYRVVDADTDRTWFFFRYNNKSYAAAGAKLYETTTFDFTEVTSTGLTGITDVKISNGVVYFAQGDSVNIRRWNGTTWADDGTNKANKLYVYYDETNGPQVWRATSASSKISRANAVAWGTNLAFSAEIPIGENTAPITGMCGYNNALWIFKKDSVWSVRNDKAAKLDVGIDDALSQSNGLASVAHGLFLYFSFVTSLERLYGGTLDDVGPNRGGGLPADRTGPVSALDSVMGVLFVGVNAFSGTSSVYIFDGINYHEIFRAPEAGKTITSVKWQSRADDGTTPPVLWISCGGDIVYITFPKFSMNPRKDTASLYMPEAHLITSTIDMNAARLPKLFKEMTAITKNLGVSLNVSRPARSALINPESRIGLDYQCDDDIGTDNWTEAGDFTTSPMGVVGLNLGKRYSIRFRFRFMTSDASNPPIMQASVLEGVARTPVKYQWVLRGKFSSIQATLNGAPDHKPLQLMRWLKEKAASAERIIMHSSLSTMDGKLVLIEPMSAQYEFSTPTLKSLGGNIVIVIREA